MDYSRTISRWTDSLVERGYRQSTIEGYSSSIIALAKQSDLKSITAPELRDWMMKDFGRVSAGANAARRKAAVSFFVWARGARWRSGDPSEGLPLIKTRRGLPRPAPSSAIRDVMAATNPTTATMIALAALAGLRCMEIAHLRIDHIDIATRRLWVVDGKGGKDRVVVISERLATRLVDQIADRNDGPLFYFCPTSLTPPRKLVSQRIANAFRQHGQPVTAHQLRHWFATELLRSSRNIRIVQELLGHASLATTQLYCHVMLDDAAVSLHDLDNQIESM